MLFNSYIFVLLFLPSCLAGYFALNHFRFERGASYFLLGMSLWFYAYFNIKYLPIILFSICFNFFFHRLLCHTRRFSVRKTALCAAVLFNLGLLFFFKYYDFFFSNVNLAFGSSFVLKHLVLPLGISFFTFQQISLVIDTYWGETAEYGFLDYALFVSYFPQLIAGPIVTHQELIPQFQDPEKRKLNWDNFSRGLYLFALGMGKKVILADTFGNAVNWGFNNIGSLDTINGGLIMLSYTFQIYFDFSGYCDMASGIAKMMNIDLPLNFKSPYRAFTITEFWERWHITLTRFFTRYVYIPLGGSRGSALRTYRNIILVFLVSGLWHGANWTFVIWGGLHGVFVVITRHFHQFFEKLHPALNWLLTFVFVNITWIFFRANSIRQALLFGYQMALLNFSSIKDQILNCFALPELRLILEALHINFGNFYNRFCLLIFFLAALWLAVGGKNAVERTDGFRPSLSRSAVTVFLLTWCIFSFSGISAFLYFNF